MANEQIPLVILWQYLKKHKVLSLLVLLVVVLGFGSYIAINRYIKEKQVEEEVNKIVNRINNIVGKYKGLNEDINISLTLSADNTATFECYGVSRQYGYWKEFGDDGPIEIDFSDSFEIPYNNYISTLYLYEGFLWQSMDAIKSRDFSKSWPVNKVS